MLRRSTIALAAACSLTLTLARAEPASWSLEGGVTAVSLYPANAAVKDGHTLSADLFARRPTAGGEWLVYLEGNSSLDPEGASTLFSEANADAGSALDADNGGRIQISELSYRFDAKANSRLTLGLLDASGYLDRTRITNDENVQFLGASFVNNPTIEFPDYTLGIVYERPARDGVPQINAVLTSANGLADNPNLSYSQLLRLTDSNDGAFAGLGLGWVTDKQLIRIGAWVNTRPHVPVAGDSGDESNYGLYFVFGRSWSAQGLNLRLGAANETVTKGSAFASFAYRYRWRTHALGLAVAQIFLSPDVLDPATDDTTQAELFARFNMTANLHLTASIQRLRHSGFVTTASDPRFTGRIAGLRLHYSF